MNKRLVQFLVLVTIGTFFTIIITLLPHNANQIKANKIETVEVVNIIDTFKINGGTFNLSAHVIIISDTAIAADFVRRNFDSTEIGMTFNMANGMTFSDNGRHQPVLWLANYPKTPEQVSDAIHELMHLTYAMLQYVGIELSNETEEVYAYELGYLSKQFFEYCASKSSVNK